MLYNLTTENVVVNDIILRNASLEWPELALDKEDADLLNSIDSKITKINKYSFTVSTSNGIRCTLPSQCILQAISIMSVAIECLKYYNFFDKYREKKDISDFVNESNNNALNLEKFNFDSYSEMLFNRYFISNSKNDKFKPTPKNIYNSSNRVFRQDSDHYSSYVLKLIGVPAASSGEIGSFIYNLASHPEAYERFYDKYVGLLPFIIKTTNIRNFVFEVIDYIWHFDNMKRLLEHKKTNINGIDINIEYNQYAINKAFYRSKELDEERFHSASTPRCFSIPLFIDEEGYNWFCSNQWNGPDYVGSGLKIIDFINVINELYPELILSLEDGNYYLKRKSQSKTMKPNDSLQKIFYGAPGTGKSHKIKEVLKTISKNNKFRTTFHPDSDYSTFVGAYKPTMKEQYRYENNIKVRYPENDNLTNSEKGSPIIERVIEYNFIPQAFLKAYIQAYKVPEEVYLIIEEINRGNCAQIFGDLFQLLDRDEDGKSEYPIKADADICAFLKKELGEESDGIKDDELCLPPNLYIWATMNTSDQSLFPIDSAFKRRWDWKYMPIEYNNTSWKIIIGENEKKKTYQWTKFQHIINNKIFSVYNSEDKQLGDYFVNIHDDIITTDLFLNKILFYLWNDVCKDGDGDIFKIIDFDDNKKTKDVKFSDFFGQEEDKVKKLQEMMAFLQLKAEEDNDETTEIETETETEPETSTENNNEE